MRPFAISKKANDNAYIIYIPPNLNMSTTFNIADIYSYYPPNRMETLETELEACSFDTQGEYNAGEKPTSAK